MTKAAQALAAWEALSQQHAACLAVIYHADQEAEAEQRNAWTSGGRPQKAAVWRWLPYRPGRTASSRDRSNLAVPLRAHGLDHAESIAAFLALSEQALVHLNQSSGARSQDVKLTTWGRKVARAGGVDPAHGTKGLLSEGLWAMLTSVWTAHPDGYPASDSGAWNRLLELEPDPYVRVSDTSTDQVDRHRIRRVLLLTDAGADHYRTHWGTYARAYPSVDAPHPEDATAFWPAHIDRTLARLRAECTTLRDLITGIPEAIATLTAPDTAAPPPGIELPHLPPTCNVPASLAATLDRLHRANLHTQSAVERATARYNAAVRDALTGYADVLGDHIADAYGPYRDACVHYTATAAAVLDAVLGGHDPAEALQEALHADRPTGPGGPWTPSAPPTTGIPDLDARLHHAHKRVTPPKRRRTTDDPGPLTAATLTDYADTITNLLAEGHLRRLLLRRMPQP